MSDVSLTVATSQISPQSSAATYTKRQDQLGDEASPAQPAVDETAARSQRLDRDRRRQARREDDQAGTQADHAASRQGRRRLPDRADHGDHAPGWTQRRRRVVAGEVYTVRVHHEPGEELWAEVLELPGCFAAGADMEELREALSEAISLYLSEPGDVKHVELEDEPGSVTEHRMLARTA